MGNAGDVFDFARVVQASSEYGDAHRGLLKILIDRGSLTEKAFVAHFVRCYATLHYLDEIDYDRNELNLTGVTEDSVAKLRKKLMTVMNTKANHIGLRLMNAHDEVRNKKMIVLVSERHYSPAMAGASPFDSHNELFLVVSWLEEMLKTDNDGYMPMTEALRSARNLPVPMKMEKAQELIDQLLKDDWIRVEAGDMVTLTTRALTELGPILRSRFHCATCCLCSNVIIRKASMLSCNKCECLMHVSCWNNLAARTDTESVRCPNNCKNNLDKEDMEESIKQIEEARTNPAVLRERRAHSTDSEPGPSKKTTRGKKAAAKKTANRPSASESEEEAAVVMADDDEESEDDVFLSKSQKKGRKHARRSSSMDSGSQKQPRKRSKDDDEEEEEEGDDAMDE